MSLYDNFICENNDNKCQYVKPFSKLEFKKNNPNTGKQFTENEIVSISNHFFNSCASKGGKVNYCCNPFDKNNQHTLLGKELTQKYPFVRANRNDNNITSFDICNKKNMKDCPGDGWKKPVPYDICKINNGKKIKGENGVSTITNLKKDCFTIHCNPQEPEITLANFIGATSDEHKYTYYDDINIVDAIKSDSVQALIKDYMPKITDINRPLTHNDRGETMLHESIRNGSDAVMAFLVGRGADLNVKNVEGDTPLHLGARLDKKNLVYALLNYGAKINLENNNNEYPIFDAVKDGSIEMLRILHNQGGNIYHVNKNKETLLHIAIVYAIKDKAKKVKFLVEHGCKIDAKNKQGKNAIDVANEMTELMMEDKNSDIILEGFSCISGFKKYDKYYDDDIPEILTYLQKVSYRQNKDKYEDYIIGKSPNGSFIEFDYNVCVGGKNKGMESTKQECIKGGGKWTKYPKKKANSENYNNSNNTNTHDYYYDNSKTKVHVEYDTENEIQLDAINQNDLYEDKCRKPVPVKILPHMTGELGLSDKDQEKTDLVNKINNNSVNKVVNQVNDIKNKNIVEGFSKYNNIMPPCLLVLLMSLLLVWYYNNHK